MSSLTVFVLAVHRHPPWPAADVSPTALCSVTTSENPAVCLLKKTKKKIFLL